MKPILPTWLVCLAIAAVADNVCRTPGTCCHSLNGRCEVQAEEGKDAASPIAKKRESLNKLQQYVGQWRGVGQPKRGSTKDSWIEKSGWAWKFAGSDVSLQMNSEDAKFFRSAELRPGADADEYELTGKTADGTEVKYAGKLSADGLVMKAEKPVESAPSRVSIRLVADGDRMVVLYERQAEGDRFARLAEVSSTRQGSGFGKGTSFVECVVTGGLGTIAVTHQGKTYYVCCTGCRDYFNDNPEEVLAEYRARKDAKK